MKSVTPLKVKPRRQSHEKGPLSMLLFSLLSCVPLLWPHGPHHLSSNSCPMNWWCYLIVSSCTTPFSICLRSLPASGSFPNESAFHLRGPKYWGFSFSISPSNEYSGFICLGLISLQSKRLSRVFRSTTIQKYQFFGAQPFVWSNSHIHTFPDIGSVLSQKCRTSMTKHSNRAQKLEQKE